MLDRNPLAGPDPSGKQTDQPYAGTDDDLKRYISGEVLAITGKTSSR